jgi:hypothetical protein
LRHRLRRLPAALLLLLLVVEAAVLLLLLLLLVRLHGAVARASRSFAKPTCKVADVRLHGCVLRVWAHPVAAARVGSHQRCQPCRRRLNISITHLALLLLVTLLL